LTSYELCWLACELANSSNRIHIISDKKNCAINRLDNRSILSLTFKLRHLFIDSVKLPFWPTSLITNCLTLGALAKFPFQLQLSLAISNVVCVNLCIKYEYVWAKSLLKTCLCSSHPVGFSLRLRSSLESCVRYKSRKSLQAKANFTQH